MSTLRHSDNISQINEKGELKFSLHKFKSMNSCKITFIQNKLAFLCLYPCPIQLVTFSNKSCFCPAGEPREQQDVSLAPSTAAAPPLRQSFPQYLTKHPGFLHWQNIRSLQEKGSIKVLSCYV